MTEAMWIRSHLERLLQDEWGRPNVCADAEGDYLVPPTGTAACWISMVPIGDHHLIRIWAHAAVGLRKSMKLLNELNDIQLRCTSVALGLCANGSVTVSQTISPLGLTPPTLMQSIAGVIAVAEDIGVLLTALFGGSTPFPVALPPLSS
jgi:hypothetical protein